MEPDKATTKRVAFPLWYAECHLLPQRCNAYGYLNLFGAYKDKEEEAYEDGDERRRVFRDFFQNRVRRGAAAARKEGGEVGRAAATILKMLEDSRVLRSNEE